MLTYLIVLFFNACSPSYEEPCLRQFQEAYNELKSISQNPKGISMSYSVEVTTAAGEKQREHLAVKFFGKKSYVQSSSVVLYQDASAMVAIHQEEKVILITNPVPAAWKQAQLAGIVGQQDSLISNLNLKNCSAEMRNNRPLQKMEFTVKGGLKKSGIHQVTYWLEGTVMKEILIDYQGKASVRSWRISIEELNTHYEGESFPGSATSQVFDRSKKLKSNYSSYTLVDKRN